MATIPKSRLGCGRCRQRRIKCDETKPSCVQCTSKSKTCPGYDRRFKWIQENPTSADARQNTPRKPNKHKRASPPPFFSNTETSLQLASSDLTDLQRSALFPWRDITTMCSNKADMLIRHYFDHLCGIMSNYDGCKNPFRSTVLSVHHKSPLINYCVMACSGSYLVQRCPELKEDTMAARKKAFQLITRGLESSPETQGRADELMLALLMLGSTASWVESGNLGISIYGTMQSLLRYRLSHISTSDAATVCNVRFFSEALVYRYMLLAFVANDEEVAEPSILDDDDSFGPTLAPALKYPHPWTGTSAKTHLLFGRVGALLKRQRSSMLSTHTFQNSNDLMQSLRDVDIARELEDDLLNLVPMEESNLLSLSNCNVSAAKFFSAEKSVKLTGLLLLYRAFPDLLRSRISLTTPNSPWAVWSSQGDSLKAMEDQWLTSFAVHILELINEKNTAGSHNHALIPLILLAVAGELSFPIPKDQRLSNPDWLWEHSLSSVPKRFRIPSSFGNESGDLSEIEAVKRSRALILSLATDMTYIFPISSTRMVVDIMKETWRRMDTSNRIGSFWIDVMFEKGWISMFG